MRAGKQPGQHLYAISRHIWFKHIGFFFCHLVDVVVVVASLLPALGWHIEQQTGAVQRSPSRSNPN